MHITDLAIAPPNLYDAVGYVRNLSDGALRSYARQAGRILISPQYVQAEWYPIGHLQGEQYDAGVNPRASRWRRWRNMATVLGVAAAEDLLNLGENVHAAVAVRSPATGEAYAGILPDGATLGTYSSDGAQYRTVALGEGPELLQCSVGIVDLRGRVAYVVAVGMELLEQNLSLGELAHKFPDAPLL